MLAFAATLPARGGDRERVEEAAADVRAIGNAIFADADDVEGAIEEVLEAIEAVTRTGDAAGVPVRRVLGVLLLTLGREGV
jgi:asparagine synthetase B (glutamine-hydrolysing)